MMRRQNPCVFAEKEERADLLRRMLRTAWPSTFESFLTSFVTLIDAAMVSSLGKTAVAAVGLTAQPRFIALTPFMAIHMAVPALVARRTGEGDRDSANLVLKQALLISVVLSCVVSIGGILLAGPLLRLTGSQPDTHLQAVTYFRIIIGGLGFNVISMIINSAQRGCGNTRIAFYTNSVSNLVNVALNYLLIEGHFGFPALGITGAAVATVTGMAVAALMSILSVYRPNGFLRLSGGWRHCFKHSNRLYTLISLSKDIFFELFWKRIGLWLYAMLVARLGTDIYAAHQIGINLLTICFSVGDGLSVAALTLIGQSLGEKAPDKARSYLNICQKMGLCFSVFFSIIFLFGGRSIFSIFFDESAIIENGVMISYLIALIIFPQIAQVIYIACLRSAGDTRYTALLSFISITVVRPSLGFLFCYVLHGGLLGAWIAILCEQVCRLLLSWWRVRHSNWTSLQI